MCDVQQYIENYMREIVIIVTRLQINKEVTNRSHNQEKITILHDLRLVVAEDWRETLHLRYLPFSLCGSSCLEPTSNVMEEINNANSFLPPGSKGSPMQSSKKQPRDSVRRLGEEREGLYTKGHWMMIVLRLSSA